MGFLTDLDISLVPGSNDVTINGVLRYYSDRYRLFIAVDHGFRTNLASIPQAAWSAIGLHPFDHCIRRGAAVHDWGYSGQSTAWLTRRQWDKVLYDCCIEDGMSRDLAKLVYLAVRAGGEQYYKGAA